MAPVWEVLHRFSCSNRTVQNAPKYYFWIQWSGSGAFVLKNSDVTSFSELVRKRASVQLVLHRLSCSNETVRNAPKHEFWVQWSGSGAFITKNFYPTSFSELAREWHQFGQLCIYFRAVTERSETPRNMSFGSNGVDQVRSLRKIPTQLRLANLCVNGTSSAIFVSTFVQ
jgi:hypothetical protein